MQSKISFFIVVALCLCLPSPSLAVEPTFVKLKRSALWVPDLDRAIVFYRDVLGFTLKSHGALELKEDSVLFDLFNVDSSLEIRRALFSSSTEENVLFVMQALGAPVYSQQAKRVSSLVIQTKDLDAVISRAEQHGFEIGATNLDISATEGTEFRETVIIGPGGQAALIYQFLTAEAAND